MSLVTIREASRALAVSERHVRRMISKGRWPYYRLGAKAIRLDLKEVRALGRLISEGKPREAGNE